MREKLWYFTTNGYDGYHIKEATVLEETEKQFFVNANGWRQRVRKADMENCNHCYFLTREEADKALIAYFKRNIDWAKTAIKNKEAEIVKFKTLLKERYGIEEE